MLALVYALVHANLRCRMSVSKTRHLGYITYTGWTSSNKTLDANIGDMETLDLLLSSSKPRFPSNRN